MKRALIAAVAAVALSGCGPDESGLPVGAAAQAVTATSEHPPPPVNLGPTRASTEELFRDASPLVTSPEDRTLADREHYLVDVQPPPSR